ncbi:MAG: AAA family ATPase [Planctomycetes bacterium]|nr:AAA family ATPase [Planctomycetota bacterium]
MATKKAKTSKRSTASKRRKPAQKPSAYFLSLKVENVRCFGAGAQTLDLSDTDGGPAHWTVILGDNGTGKSTLLECLAAFDAVRDTPDASASGPVNRAGQWVQSGREHHLPRLGSASMTRLRIVAAFGGGLKIRSTTLETAVTDIAYFGPSGLNFTIAYARSDAPLPFCCAYGVSRRMGSSSLSGRSDDRTASLFDDRVELLNAEEWLLQLDYAAAKSSTIRERQRERLKEVRRLLIDILPDVKDIRISTPTEERPRPGVEFKTDDGWVPLRWIGYGYRTAVAWMVDLTARLVQRYPNSKNPLLEPAVVLIDEIDLHLHPSWQRHLMTHVSARFPNVQFIVTAHSPLFVQAAEGANLVVLKREKDRVVIDNDVQAVEGWRVDQVLTSDLFGLKSARPPKHENLLAQRKKLLTKAKLTKPDRKKLAVLEEQIGSLPGGETADDARTMARIERTLSKLEKKRSRARDTD